jgi:glycosyltransferase involved in cell wall biosynthesis
MSDENIAALIPAWNEARHISSVVERTLKHLPVLVVDDGSHDGTGALAEEAGADVIRHETNRGKGIALVTGFDWVVQQGLDAVITLDADAQHDPDEIHKFLTAYRQNAGDLIIGRRDFSKMPYPNRLANPIGSWLLTKALGTHIPDNQSGYRLLSRELLKELELLTTGFELEVEVIIQAVCKGFRIAWVGIETIYHGEKKSYFHPFHDSVRFLSMVWKAYRARRNVVPSDA